MAHHAHNPYGADQRSSDALDRKREKERKFMLNSAFKNAEELAGRLVQRLIDSQLIETTSNTAIQEVLEKQLKKLSEIEDFDVQFKIAPVRGLVPNPNFVSLYITQYIVEDLLEHSKVQDIFGDDLEIYNAVESILRVIRPDR